MAKVFTINGKGDTDELLRLKAFEEIDGLETAELTRLAELKNHPKARGFLKTTIAFKIAMAFFK